MCPLEALRLGYDTPEIRAAAALMQQRKTEMAAMMGSSRSFGRARMQSDGSIEYARKGHEPPPNLDGYERDKGNPWRFVPLWPKCKKRIQTQSLKPCGAISILTVCANGECPFKQQQVSFAQCSACECRVTE